MSDSKDLTSRTIPYSAGAFHHIRRLPKVSLHCHLEGTVRPTTLLSLCERNAVTLEGFDAQQPESLYRFTDFMGFLQRFRDVCRALVHPADYGQIAREFVDDAINDNIRYAELFLSPAGWQRLHPELDLRLAMEEIALAFAQARTRGLEVAVIVDLTRNFGPLVALETTDLALSWRDLGVIGLGLGGDEAGFPAPLFADAFTLARKGGLRCVAHAGEAAGAQSVRETVEVLHVERVGHGIRAIEDPQLMEDLARRGIAFEQSPTSNLKTGVVPHLAAHPIGACVEAGIRVAIDADDPGLFRTSITHEMALLEPRLGLEFINNRLHDAITVSFANSSTQLRLFRELDEVLTKTELKYLSKLPGLQGGKGE